MALSIQHRLTTDIQSGIIGLGLVGTDGITGPIEERVLDHLIPEQLAATSTGLPCIVVETTQRPIREEPGTFEDRWGVYQVRVWILDMMRPNYQQCQNDYTTWIHEIWAYMDPREGAPLLANTPEFLWAEHGGSVVLTEDAARSQLAKGYLDLLCWTAEAKQTVGGSFAILTEDSNAILLDP